MGLRGGKKIEFMGEFSSECVRVAFAGAGLLSPGMEKQNWGSYGLRIDWNHSGVRYHLRNNGVGRESTSYKLRPVFTTG